MKQQIFSFVFLNDFRIQFKLVIRKRSTDPKKVLVQLLNDFPEIFFRRHLLLLNNLKMKIFNKLDYCFKIVLYLFWFLLQHWFVFLFGGLFFLNAKHKF